MILILGNNGVIPRWFSVSSMGLRHAWRSPVHLPHIPWHWPSRLESGGLSRFGEQPRSGQRSSLQTQVCWCPGPLCISLGSCVFVHESPVKCSVPDLIVGRRNEHRTTCQHRAPNFLGGKRSARFHLEARRTSDLQTGHVHGLFGYGTVFS